MAKRKSSKGKTERCGSRMESPVMDHPKFEEYYKSLNIVAPEDWDRFMSCLRAPLPTNFRSTAFELRALMIREHFPALKLVQLEGELLPIPTELPWYPNGLGWQFNIPKATIRRDPEIAKFHRFLVSETESGNINRQEAVSMIPPLVLDVKPHHYVLDMCAAPGSKTGQIIEAIHAGRADSSSNSIPKGMVIANDSNYDRSYLLIRQTKRLQSPCLMVTNHEAQMFPFLYYTDNDDRKQKPLLFDRVLADVPCSGDGTMRKNMLIWKTWNGNNGNSLHKLQTQILLRGVELLKVGGRIVYSTCSFNPIENEAVVAEALRACGGSLELVDVSDNLTSLSRNPGIIDWTVMGKDGTIYESFDQVPESLWKAIPATAFPPNNAAHLGLEKCMRVLPFQQDTGGFFVAVLVKTASYGTFDKREHRDNIEPESQPLNLSDSETQHETKKAKIDHVAMLVEESNSLIELSEESKVNPTKSHPKRGKKAFPGKEAEFIFLSRDAPEVANICAFYGIPDSFPREQLIVRSETTKKKNMYFCNLSIKQVIQASNAFKLQIVNSGIKLFSRNEGNGDIGCPFRLCNDGIDILCTFNISKRKMKVHMSDILLCLREAYPRCTSFTKPVQERLEELGQGTCIFEFDATADPSISFKIPIIVPIWRGKSSVSMLLDKLECRALLMRITGEEYLTNGKATRAGLDRDASHLGDKDESSALNEN